MNSYQIAPNNEPTEQTVENSQRLINNLNSEPGVTIFYQFQRPQTTFKI